MIFTAVPQQALSFVWGDVVNLMYKSVATSGGKFHMDDLYRMIDKGEYVLWLVLDGEEKIAAITTRIIVYPNRKAMAMDWIGGSQMGEWLPIVQETLEQYAKDNDCQHLEGYGRKAWGRWLGKYGWKPEYIAYRMELSDG